MAAFYYRIHPLSSPVLDEMDRVDRPRIVVPFDVYKEVSDDANELVLDEMCEFLSAHADFADFRDETHVIGTLPDYTTSEDSLSWSLMEFGEGRRPEYNFGTEKIVRENIRVIFVVRGGKIRGDGYVRARKCAEVAYRVLGSVHTQILPTP